MATSSCFIKATFFQQFPEIALFLLGSVFFLSWLTEVTAGLPRMPHQQKPQRPAGGGLRSGGRRSPGDSSRASVPTFREVCSPVLPPGLRCSFLGSNAVPGDVLEQMAWDKSSLA